MKVLRAIVLVLGSALMAGCGVIPATTSIPLPPGTSTEQVFACAEQVTRVLAEGHSHWDAQVTRRDETRGVIQFGQYDEWNRMGYRYRLEIASPKSARIRLLATSLYLEDLGARPALRDLKSRIATCLEETARARMPE